MDLIDLLVIVIILLVSCDTKDRVSEIQQKIKSCEQGASNDIR